MTWPRGRPRDEVGPMCAVKTGDFCEPSVTVCVRNHPTGTGARHRDRTGRAEARHLHTNTRRHIYLRRAEGERRRCHTKKEGNKPIESSGREWRYRGTAGVRPSSRFCWCCILVSPHTTSTGTQITVAMLPPGCILYRCRCCGVLWHGHETQSTVISACTAMSNDGNSNLVPALHHLIRSPFSVAARRQYC